MSDNITTRKHLTGKKRYIAVAALAGLVATGGVISATVTSESTVVGNQVTVTAQPTGANVTVSGAPIALSLERGVRPDGDITNPGNPILESVNFPVGSWTLTNSGETDATVKLLELDVKLPVEEGLSQTVAANIRFTSGSSTLLNQHIGGHNPVLGGNPSITVPAGASITVNAELRLGTAFIDKMQTYDKTFDLQFDYVDKK